MSKAVIAILVTMLVGVNVFSYKYAGSESEDLTYVFSREFTYVVDSEEGVLMASYVGYSSSTILLPGWVAWIEEDSLVYKTREGVIIRSHIDQPNFEGWIVVDK